MATTTMFRTALRGALVALMIGAGGAFAQEAETPAVPPVVEETPAQEAPAVQPPAEEAPAEGEPAAGAPADEPAAFDAPGVADDVEVDVSGIPHDLSPWGMFLMADWVVKAVMIGLAFASLVTWTVWLAKSLEIAGAKRRASRALDRIVAARSLEEAASSLEKSAGPAALLVKAAQHEAAMSADVLRHGGGPGLKERVASHLGRIEAQAGRRMTRGTGLLATIGSTAPFVGLFGTVWGIMNSFIGIAEAQTTNLAVVAPGIAEALFATALGLVAAIPAVVIYNVFARSIAGYRLQLADASAAVERLVSRDLDRMAVPARPRAAE